MTMRFRRIVLLCTLLLVGLAVPLPGETKPPAKTELNDWPYVGGTPSRDGQARGDLPILEARWRKPTFEQPGTKSWIDEARNRARERKQALIPSAVPITATCTRAGRTYHLLVYRSHWGVHAVDLLTGELSWRAASSWSLDMMQTRPQKQPALNGWASYYQQTLGKPALLFENTTLGTLSSDGAHVFAVEDLAVAPPPQPAQFDPRFGQPFPMPRYEPQVSDAVYHSRLQAYDLVTGKLKWEVGGRDEKAGELADSFFLGPPLPLAGKLFVLTEKNKDLRLACLDPNKGTVLATQTLAAAKDPMQASTRRMHASHLAHADGILVCPTNAGAVLGIDPMTRTLLWVYGYREQTTPTPPTDPQFQQLRFRRQGSRLLALSWGRMAGSSRPRGCRPAGRSRHRLFSRARWSSRPRTPGRSTASTCKTARVSGPTRAGRRTCSSAACSTARC